MTLRERFAAWKERREQASPQMLQERRDDKQPYVVWLQRGIKSPIQLESNLAAAQRRITELETTAVAAQVRMRELEESIARIRYERDHAQNAAVELARSNDAALARAEAAERQVTALFSRQAEDIPLQMIAVRMVWYARLANEEERLPQRPLDVISDMVDDMRQLWRALQPSAVPLESSGSGVPLKVPTNPKPRRPTPRKKGGKTK